MRRFSFVSLITFTLMLAACGDHPDLPTDASDAEIVHGQAVRATDPLGRSVVALVSEQDQGQALCTGTVISSDTILTAAHCVDGQPQKLIAVFAPKVKTAAQAKMRVADRFVQHPNWAKSAAADRTDLALVHFAGGLPDGFQAVSLANKDFAVSNGDEITFLGYGVTNGKTRAGAGALRKTKSHVVGTVSPTEIISDGEKNSVCFGDSGGPAFGKAGEGFVQWGVASSVLNDTCNQASIHTAIMSYRTWIDRTQIRLRKLAK